MMSKRSETNVESGSGGNDTSNSISFETAQSTSGRISPLPFPTVKYSVHENVIKEISEHREWIQFQGFKQSVIGLLFGEQKQNNIKITYAIELDDGSIQNIINDSKNIRKYESVAKGLEETVFTVVGWYTTASPTNEEIKMHKQFCNIISCPIILRLEFVGCEKKPKISMQTLVIRFVDGKPGFMFGDVTHMLDVRGKILSNPKSVALDPVASSSKQVSSSNVMTSATIPSLNVFLNSQMVLKMTIAFSGSSKEQKLVVGGLVGTKKGENVNILKSFQIFSVDNDQDITFDMDALKTVVEYYTKMNKDWMLLGWYNTRSRLSDQDIKAHKEICTFTQDPIMLQISLSQNIEAIVKVYGSTTDTIDSKKETFLFKLPHTIIDANLKKHRAIDGKCIKNEARTKISDYLLEMIQNVPDRLSKIHNKIFGKKKDYADK